MTTSGTISCAPDIDNVRDALEWSLVQGHDIALGAELGAILSPYWESRSYGEGKRWLTAAHAVLDQLEPHVAARVLLEYVRALPFDEHAIALSEAAVRAYRDGDDAPGLCRALEYRARTLINIGRYDDAARVLAESEHLSSGAAYHAGAARLEALHGFADSTRAIPNRPMRISPRPKRFCRRRHLRMSLRSSCAGSPRWPLCAVRRVLRPNTRNALCIWLRTAATYASWE